MGATAFALFGMGQDRSIEKWRLNDQLYNVALKAVNDHREKRQQSLAQFESEWKSACDYLVVERFGIELITNYLEKYNKNY